MIRKLELNDEEDALSLQCNEQFDDSFEKKSAADANKDDMDEIQFIGERFKETKPNVDLLKPLETEEDRESKEIKLKVKKLIWKLITFHHCRVYKNSSKFLLFVIFGN